MNEDKINKLISLLDLVDTKANIEEFVNVFSQVVEFLKGNQEQLGAELAVVLTEIDRLTKQMADDSKEDANQIRGMVASAIMDLRSGIDRDRENLEQKVAERLATLKDGKDGAPGQTVVGKNGADGKDGSPDTPDQVVEKVNTSSLLIKKERIEGLTDLMRNIASNVAGAVGITTTNFFKNGTFVGRAKNINFTGSGVSNVSVSGDQANVSITGGGSGGGQVNSVVAGTGISVDSTDPVNPIVSSTITAFAGSQEKSTTSADGSTQTFAFIHTPKVIFWNGSFQTLTDDYTVSSNNITFTASAGTPQTNDKIVNLYA